MERTVNISVSTNTMGALGEHMNFVFKSQRSRMGKMSGNLEVHALGVARGQDG